MPKCLSLISLFFITINCFSQNYCSYTKPHKFEAYSIELNSEQAGLFLNGINLSKKTFQLEGNTFLGAFHNYYKGTVAAGLIQLRYALNNSTEIQSGGSLLYPHEINADTLFSQQYQVGVKQKIFRIDKKSTRWYLALSVKYVAQRSWLEGHQVRRGASLSLNNTWKFYKVLQVDLAIGAQYFPSDKLFIPLLSGKLLMKDDASKVGYFIGICGDHYAESYLSLGLHFSDNYNYILQASIGFLDKAITPNISYTHIFRKLR